MGREREAGLIGGLLDDVHDRGAALVVEGVAGIGKSALLSRARAMARDGGTVVLSTTAVQSEADLPFAGLHQLLRPLLPRVGDLPGPQREAVRVAFGMAEGMAPQPFLIGLGVLGLLGDAAASQPLLLCVEDAHWLDRASADAVGFVARRVESDPIVVLVAIREGYESPLREAGLPELHLGGLSDEAARQLLGERFPGLSALARGRVLAEAEGNPLGLLELGEAVGGSESAAGALFPAGMPLTMRLERAFAARVAELPDATRVLVRIAAADEASGLAIVLAAAQIVDGVARTVEDLAPAIEAKLVEVDGEELRFRHPLVRSAIYQAASVDQRHAAHAALAAVLVDEPDRSVWHRAAATVGPDAQVASDLEDAARRALRRGAVATAAGAFERAAALTRESAERGRLLVDAAAAASELGRAEAVIRLLQAADSLGLGPRERAQAMLIEDRLREGPAGDPARVRQLVDTAARVATLGDRDLALDLLMAAASRCYWGDLREQGHDVVSAADALEPAADDPRMLFVEAFAAPVERGAEILRVVDGTAVPDDPIVSYLRGMSLSLIGAYAEASPLLSASARRLREEGRVRMLAQVLSIQAMAALGVADFAVAVPVAEEARSLASENPYPLWETGANIAQATLAALRGERAKVEALTRQAERVAVPAGAAALLGLVQCARGLLELGQGRHADAYEELRRIAEPNTPSAHHLIQCLTIGDFVEAAARSGHRTTAAKLMAEVEPLSRRLPSPWFHAELLLARVHLATDDQARAVFQGALREEMASFPMIRARIELACGEWLRRHRRRRESRDHLRAARDAFDALGVDPWAERARRELRASGEISRRRQRDSLDELTPQELQIAQLAAQGLSNREIAQQLYLSPRTVESHLYRVFPKLDVTSRSQLVARVAAGLAFPADGP